MVKRCIGIDMSYSLLCAVQVSRTNGQFLIEKAFSTQIRRSTDLPSNVLRQLINQHGFDRRAEVAVSMSHDTVFFRNLESDCAEDVIISQNHFPLPNDEIITQIYSHQQLSDGRFSVLVAAASKKSMREKLAILDKAKMAPKLVDAPIFAIHSAVMVNHPQIATGVNIIVYINEHHLALAVIQDCNIQIIRNIPVVFRFGDNVDIIKQYVQILSREVEVTWRKVFGTDIEPDYKIYLVTGGCTYDYLEALIEENLHCKTITVNPFANVRTLFDYEADQSSCAYSIAVGLALRVLAPERTKGINFLTTSNANIRSALNMKKELLICGTLVGAIFIFWFFGLLMHVSGLESNYARTKKEIRDIFKTTIPEEDNIVSPLVQLEQRLQYFKEDYKLFASFRPDDLSPMEVLHTVTMHRPSQANLSVNDILITADMVRIMGTCDSFESVYQWQRLLREVTQFTLVEVQDIQRRPQGAVDFTLLLSAAIEERT